MRLTRPYWFGLRGLVLGVGIVSLSSCVFWQRDSRSSGEAASVEQAVAVDAVIAKTGALTDALTFTGTTRPQQQVVIRSRVDGQITLLTADVGDSVTDGDVIAQLEADLLTVQANQAEAELRAQQSEVAQAQASVSDARTALETARLQLRQAETDADRLRRLAEAGAVAIQEAEQAQLAVDTAQQVLRSAEEQIRTRQEAVNVATERVDAQQAALDETQEQLAFALVRSPLSGTVLSRLVETGDYVESGEELLQIGDLSQLKVIIEISDRQLAQVALGQPVNVQLDALPEDSVAGQITQIAPVADSASRLIPVEITMPNQTRRLGSGLLARVRLQEGESDRVTIPTDALELAEATPNPVLFIVQSVEGQAATVQARNVTIGRQANNQTEILTGLAPGETFVIRSSGPLTDGQTVRLSVLSETSQQLSPQRLNLAL